MDGKDLFIIDTKLMNITNLSWECRHRGMPKIPCKEEREKVRVSGNIIKQCAFETQNNV